MNYILSIIGKFEYHDVNFAINKEYYNAKILSAAMYNYLTSKGEECRLVLFVPESLVGMLEEDIDEAYRLLNDREKLKDRVLKELIENGVVTDKVDVRIIQSIGEYSAQGRYSLLFINHLDNIVFQAFTELIDMFNMDGNVFIDISIGHNVYVYSLLEALRSIIVYSKLKALLQDSYGLKVSIASSPPIFTKGLSVNVEFHDYDVKAFFELPLKKDYSISVGDFLHDKSIINELLREFKAQNIDLDPLKHDLELLRKSFNALKYNVPLVFFNSNILNLEETSINKDKEFIINLTSLLEKQFRSIHIRDSYINIYRKYWVNRVFLTNIMFSLALLESITCFWRSKISGRQPSLNYILNVFGDIYDKLGIKLNRRFLERDVIEIENQVQSCREKLDSYKPLSTVVKRCGDVKEYIASDPKRNFFAHSGLIRDFIEAKRNDEINVKYMDKPEITNQISSWINNPEK